MELDDLPTWQDLPVSKITPELRSLLSLGAVIQRFIDSQTGETHRPHVEIPSLLLAFYFAKDRFSTWFQALTSRISIRPHNILKTRYNEFNTFEDENIEPMIHDFINSNPPSDMDQEEIGVSISVQGGVSRINEIQILNEKLILDALDVHHVMGIYIYSPGGHESELQTWGFSGPNRSKWSNAFLTYIKSYYPMEYQKWCSIHVGIFSTEHEVLLEDIIGLEVHVIPDLWTINDALGYYRYAHAIKRFLTDEKRTTKPPLTIGIHAPWGGGKTSLMRMIQKELDPRGYELSSREEELPKPKCTIKDVQLRIKEYYQEKGKTDNRSIFPFSLFYKKKGKQTDSIKKNDLTAVSETGKREPITIWFNAWKYESTDQIWAGLIDSIIRQYAARDPDKQEKFWINFHLHRRNPSEIKKEIQGIKLRNLYPWIIPIFFFLAISLIMLVDSLLNLSSLNLIDILIRVVSPAFVAFIATYYQYNRPQRELAIKNLTEYVKPPDYSVQLGFRQQAEDDLRRVFNKIKNKHNPIVIFIDDLDRISPNKVAEVVEALNILMNQNYPHCFFILGMEPEIVAAALESHFKDVIEELPSYAKSPRIGWRFMDKFIQLPLVIPPPEPRDLAKYAEILLMRKKEEPSITRLDEPITESEAEEIIVKETKKMDELIDTLVEDPNILSDLMRQYATVFSSNPRELKRFINLFFFLAFLSKAREARDLPIPTHRQLARWIELSLKWPEFVRWLRRNKYRHNDVIIDEVPQKQSMIGARLKNLECIGRESGNKFDIWLSSMLEVLIHGRLIASCNSEQNSERNPSNVDRSDLLKKIENLPNELECIADPELMRFFNAEGNYPKDDRLSAAGGRGFW